MRHVQSGSIVLSTIFFISILMLMITMQWRLQEVMQATLYARTQGMQQQYALEALLQYGVAISKNNYDLLVADDNVNRAVSLSFTRWPLGGNNYIQGILTITYYKKMHIDACLRNNQSQKVTALCCDVERETVNNVHTYTIVGWKWTDL